MKEQENKAVEKLESLLHKIKDGTRVVDWMENEDKDYYRLEVQILKDE